MLPEAVIFDLDGVITNTASLHYEAWKYIFDDYLKKSNTQDKGEFTRTDYLKFVDGRPREKGIITFLSSRNIKVNPEDKIVKEIADKKTKKFLSLLQEKGVEVYPPAVNFLKQLKENNIKCALASSSKNARFILSRAGLSDLFSAIVDGVSLQEKNLKGKPEPDMFLYTASSLGVKPQSAVVIEDASSGVAAASGGCFGLVIGVARQDNKNELFSAGADIVVRDLSQINLDWLKMWFKKSPFPLFEYWQKQPSSFYSQENFFLNKDAEVNPFYFKPASYFLKEKEAVFFLDYDGTLTPIVSRPEEAVISQEARDIITALSKKFTVSIVSGRAREDVEKLVGVEGIFYAGSHGFDIARGKKNFILPQAKKAIPLIEKITKQLKEKLSSLEGVIIEDKKFSVAVHYRLVDEINLPIISYEVENIVKREKALRLMRGKKVFEILPSLVWDKGRAVLWIMQALNLNFSSFNVIYIGDDTTDENAFCALKTKGCGILVADNPRPSFANFYLTSPNEVLELFKKLI